MAPPPLINICSIAYLHVKNMPRPSMDMTSSQSSGVASSYRRQRDDARVGDRDVEPPILIDRYVDHPASVLWLGHVRRHDGDVIGHIRKGIPQRRQAIGIDVRDDEARALAGKQFRRRTADPGCSTGH